MTRYAEQHLDDIFTCLRFRTLHKISNAVIPGYDVPCMHAQACPILAWMTWQSCWRWRAQSRRSCSDTPTRSRPTPRSAHSAAWPASSTRQAASSPVKLLLKVGAIAGPFRNGMSTPTWAGCDVGWMRLLHVGPCSILLLTIISQLNGIQGQLTRSQSCNKWIYGSGTSLSCLLSTPKNAKIVSPVSESSKTQLTPGTVLSIYTTPPLGASSH